MKKDKKMFTEKEIILAPKVYEVLKKLGWEWIPEEGEWCLETEIYYKYLILAYYKKGEEILIWKKGSGKRWAEKTEYLPILHWEKIEEILIKFGYEIVWSYCGYKSDGLYKCEIFTEKGFNCGAETGLSRQEAVMKAVLRIKKN